MPDIQRIDRTGKNADTGDYSWKSMADSIGQAANSRYRRDDFIIDEQRGVIYRETYSRSVTSRQGNKYFVVPPEYEYRPDLLAEDVYGNPKMWHVILETNGLTGIEQFVRGLTISVPGREGVVYGV